MAVSAAAEMSSKDKENSSAAASDRRPSVASNGGSGAGGGGGQKAASGGGGEAHQYVGPYRLEKTLGKGQTGKTARGNFKAISLNFSGPLRDSLIH